MIQTDDDGNNNSYLIDIIEKNSGNHDINAQSRYFNIEEYTLATNPYHNNYINIMHLNHFQRILIS